MDEYVKKKELIEFLQKERDIHCTECSLVGDIDCLACYEQWISDFEPVDVVPMEVYKQTAWERDLAIQQLRGDYGVSLGEKKRETVRHGKWVWQTGDLYMCTACNADCHVDECMNEPQYAYCPNCGAKMDLEE